MRIRAALGAGLLLALCATRTIADEECRPRRYAALDMTPLNGAGYAVPVEIGGKTYRMVFKATPLTFIFDRYVETAGLRSLEISGNKHVRVSGTAISRYARLPDISIGGNTGQDVPVLVMPAPAAADNDIVGLLGTDLLVNFDVEIDFRNRKLSLFSPDPCDGAGVYWSKSYAVLPLEKDREGQMTVPMKLDGSDVKVMFDGVSRHSSMAYNQAIHDFGVPAPAEGADTPAASSAVAEELLDPHAARLHRFSVLEADGLTINGPIVFLRGDPHAPLCNGRTRPQLEAFGVRETTCYSGPELTLGMSDMVQLHLLFAFKAGKLYLTSADAHP